MCSNTFATKLQIIPVGLKGNITGGGQKLGDLLPNYRRRLGYTRRNTNKPPEQPASTPSHPTPPFTPYKLRASIFLLPLHLSV